MAPTKDAGEKPKIILHWLEKSRSHRILWLLEELKVDYEVKCYDRTSVARLAPEDLKKVHPLGKSPVIEVQASYLKEPLVLAESGAIVEFLVEHYGRDMIPQRYEKDEPKIGGETQEYLRDRYFYHYAEGSIMSILIIGVVAHFLKSAPALFLFRPVLGTVAWTLESQFVRPNVTSHLKFLEDQMASSGGDFLCGNKLLGSDFLMEFPLETLQVRGDVTEEEHPNLSAYLKRLKGREAFKRADQKILDITGKSAELEIK